MTKIVKIAYDKSYISVRNSNDLVIYSSSLPLSRKKMVDLWNILYVLFTGSDKKERWSCNWDFIDLRKNLKDNTKMTKKEFIDSVNNCWENFLEIKWEEII